MKLQYTLPRTPPRPDVPVIYFSHAAAYPEVSLAATHGFPQFCILVFPVALKVLIFVVSSVLSAKLQYTLPRTPPRPDATAIYFLHTAAYPEVFSGSNSRFSPKIKFGTFTIGAKTYTRSVIR